jgi:hypothetical protein
MNKAKGIFCLEGEWSRNLMQTSSVEPILSLLSQWEPHFVPYVYRQVTSVSSLRDYLSQWVLKRYDHFPILYLAFHGHPGVVCLDENCEDTTELSLELLEQMLAGKCRGRIIYFGSCGTLQAHGNRLNHFLKRTNAMAICGYSGEVDWLTATAFELLVMGAMQENTFTLAGTRAMYRKVFLGAGVLARRLRFRMLIRKAS